MFQEERLYKILEMLEEKKSMTTQDIVDNFEVSRDTARRDIVKLTSQGNVLRTHGGITLPKKPRISEYYELRIHDKVEVKQRIAKVAAKLINSGDVCYFDASTTVLQLCYVCTNDIEAFSNSLNNVAVLDQRECSVHIIGGKLNHDNKFIYGYEAVEQIEQTHYNIAFLGADGIMEHGIYSYKQEDAAVKRAITRNADKIYVLTEHSKFFEKRAYKCCSMEQIDGIITDKSPGEEIEKMLEEEGTKLIIA